MSLKITVKGASGLTNLETLGKSDPYVSVSFQGEKQKTEVKSGTLDPVWDEELVWELQGKPPRSDECIEVIIKDYERIGFNKLLGKAKIPLRNILHGNAGIIEMDQVLLDLNDQPTAGLLKLAINYTPPKGGVTQADASNQETLTVRAMPMTAFTGQTHSGSRKTSSENYSRSSSTFPEVKTKFQVRVRVVEARQLMGCDISPVCQVIFGTRMQQSRVYKSTISPWFDQLFFFDEECLPSEVFRKFLEFRICNSSKLRSGTLIGSFKTEIGRIYDTVNHAVINKWLVLANPEETTPTVQGYLKVSVTVLGPGDSSPDMSSSTSRSDDVEDNLLWSTGVHLQPAYFILSIYCAEGLPRMDSGAMQTLKQLLGIGVASKELVDPYIIASFAGKELQTKVFQASRNFVVIAQLSHAYLLTGGNNPLEVEISMGNFGNRLENSLIPCPSSTNPANPVFDGCRYYYLPWRETMPLIILHCQWEDTVHRLHSTNHILSIAYELERELQVLKDLKRSGIKLFEEEAASTALHGVVARLSNNCKKQLPALNPVRDVETSLDNHLRKSRQRELFLISKDAEDVLGHAEEAKALQDLQDIVNRLQDLAVEPQLNIPDVFLWLSSGTQKLSYVRIPANEIVQGSDRCSGRLSGHFNDFLLKIPGSNDSSAGGMIRASLWFGRKEDTIEWYNYRSDLQPSIFAETYENQVVNVSGSNKWASKGLLMTRPSFSDADGLIALPKDSFKPSEGWEFQGDWFVDSDASVRYNLDAGHTLYTEEVFQQQVKIIGGSWIDSPITWCDIRGDPAIHRDEILCPEGWKWRDLWVVDLQRAVDGEGWEYIVQKGVTDWSPKQKMYHLLRRRRWIRERVRIKDVQMIEDSLSTEEWEYALVFGLRFHAIQRKIDSVRRRRWRRKLVPMEGSHGELEPPRIIVPSDDKEIPETLTCPRHYVTSSAVHKYQMRAYVYQARDLLPGDKSGFSDPYAVVVFCNSSQQTKKQTSTLCPKWDQTLIFDDVIFSGTFSSVTEDPPTAVVEVFDWDARGTPEFLGRAQCKPYVCDPLQGYQAPKLKWHQLSVGNNSQEGKLLALPPSKGDIFMVPFEIRPVLQRTRIEILCWGLRNLATYELQSVTRPSIEFECGGKTVTSLVIQDIRSNSNFDQPHLILDVELPKEQLYMPPLTLRVMDHRAFGKKPVVGTATVNDLFKYYVEVKLPRNYSEIGSSNFYLNKQPLSKSASSPLNLDFKQLSFEPGIMDSSYDWWSKYYASINEISRTGSYLKNGFEKLEVFSGSLEDDPKFAGLSDLVDTIPLHRGQFGKNQNVGEFKGTFRIFSCSSKEEPPSLLAGFPSSSPQDIVVRVYIVCGSDLAPRDSNGTSDPYVFVTLGKEVASGKEMYSANTINPIFGQMFEISGKLPFQKDLKIQIWDRDLVLSDDLIGETIIDIEDRFLSRYRATCAIAKQYHVAGSNAWRDVDSPTEILKKLSEIHNFEGPHYTVNPLSVILCDKTYTLSDFEGEHSVLPSTLGSEKERLALHVIHSSFPVVPEHVETRELQHPSQPGIPQGKLLMWVDIFPAGISLPPPVDISPRKPHRYELRVCIYNVFEAPLDETSISGEKMSDLYVKGWLQGTSNICKTDIHYRSLDGEGNFNWRMKFSIDYIEPEQLMITAKKNHFWSINETEERRPPQLILQLWDNDFISRDDYLSEMILDLCSFPKPSKSIREIQMEQAACQANGGVSSDRESTQLTIPFLEKEDLVFVDLFQVKRVYGFFPFIRNVDGNVEIVGKLEAELEVLTEEEARSRPAGYGRDEPNANPTLSEPK